MDLWAGGFVASSPNLEGVGTIVYSGQRFPNISYKLETENAPQGMKIAGGTINPVPQRLIVQLELKGVTSLELQGGELIPIMFEKIRDDRPGATFVVIGSDLIRK